MIASAPAAPSAGPARLVWPARQVPAGWLIAALLGWLALDQLLLWRFLGFAPLWASPLAVLLVAGMGRVILRAMPDRTGPTVATLLACFTVAVLLMLLGGQGRFFYANVDWQVRYAVLHDMTANPWPFVYAGRGTPDLLRAPIGMFLMPALAAKALGARAGDIALLAQNSLLLGTLLALAAPLFANRRARFMALAVFLCFGGIDAAGDLFLNGSLGDHLEDWSGLQYSSTITQIFWVPQHALAGWIGAVGYLLWRAGRLPLGAWLCLLPLTALWSPLGLMGAMPFAALAGMRALRARQWSWSDIALPALATLIALPSLLYLGAGAGEDVGARIVPLPPLQWLSFQAIETLPFLLPLLLVGLRPARFGRDTLWLAAAVLMLAPLVQVGWSIDFMMRASISALAILAAMVADQLVATDRARLWLATMLALASLTGLFEVRRALIHPPAPYVRCSVFTAWDQKFAAFPKGSYFTPLDRVPALVRPRAPARAATDAAPCWDGPWFSPTNTRRRPSGGQHGVERQADRKG